MREVGKGSTPHVIDADYRANHRELLIQAAPPAIRFA
jgi:hypothetical protein